MMKNLLSILVLSALTLTVTAQPKGMGKNDPAAKKVLDAVSKKFRTFKNITAKFSLKLENSAGKNMGVKAGTVYMKGTRYRVNVSGQEIYSDGSNVWTYDQPSNEVTISRLDPGGNSITPQKLFTNFYDKDFLYKLNGNVKLGGKTYQEIELTPIDKTKPFHKVLLYVNNNVINTTKIFEKTGNRYTYSITSMSTTAPVPDATFVFDAKKHPGVEIVDLR